VDSGQGSAILLCASQGLSGRYPLAQLAGRYRRLGRRRPLPLDEIEQGRERYGQRFRLNFLKILNRNIKSFEHDSCREFENL
jgi:hypothetical protein